MLEFANKIYLQRGFELIPEYKQTLIKDFLSDIETTSFLKPEEAANQINSWVSSVTHNRVNSLIVPGSIISPSPVSTEVWVKYQMTLTPTVTQLIWWDWSTKILTHDGKKSVSDVFLNAEFQYVYRISLSPTPFALNQSMWSQSPTYVSHWGPVGSSLDMM